MPLIRLSLCFCLLCFSTLALSQQRVAFVVKDNDTRQPLPGAAVTIESLGIAVEADENGLALIPTVADGEYVVQVSFVGYATYRKLITFPSDQSSPFEILLEHAHESLDEIVITSTRSSRTIADIPTRVEFIAGEELDEKGNMKPGDIRMLLNESTGIQTQQTSATSANASIRIQGLDGRYTQLLRDGFPLYAGFSGGLGLLQTPPLDLRQVEVIKGSSSTLYGGGAIAGMVNLVSKLPSEERELRFVANGTSAGGLDLSGFFGQQFEKAGFTLFASRNSNRAFDPADIGLTAIPEFERYTINPKLFVRFNEETSINLGVNITTEDRIGGDVDYIRGNASATGRYFERNDSRRYSTQFGLSHRFSESLSFNIKNSFNRFDRKLDIPQYTFDGTQFNSFTELNVVQKGERAEWIGGVNIWTDDFKENQLTNVPARDNRQSTYGAFVQTTVQAGEKISIEGGMRADYVTDYGFVFLPRISLMYKHSENFSSRIGGGLGYKTPTIFTEESERIQYQNVLPVSPRQNDLEKSYGTNWDLNYRMEIGEVGLSINHLFFYTYLNNPLALSPAGNGTFAFVNLTGHIDTKGTETNVKLEYGDFKLFIGYTYTDTEIHDNGVRVPNPLTARHRLNNVLMYEVEEKWKVGLEAYYFSKQRLSDDTMGKSYWICGFMAERIWERFSLFINFENFLDTRQTRFDTIFTGSVTNPVFRDIYAPVDGFVVNGGIKLNFSAGGED